MDKFFEAVKILEVWLQANGFWLPADGLWVWAVSCLLMGFWMSAVCLWFLDVSIIFSGLVLIKHNWFGNIERFCVFERRLPV